MAMILVFVFLLIYAVLTWIWVGRDPRKGQIVSWPKPPIEPNSDSRAMSAAAVDFVKNRDKLSPKGLTTVFYSLDKQGLLEIEQGRKKEFTIRPKKTPKDNPDALQLAYPEEQAVYRALTKEVKTSSGLALEPENAPLARKLNNAANNSLHRQYRKLWQHNRIFVVICYVLAVFALTLGLAVNLPPDNLRLGLLLAIGGLGTASLAVYGLHSFFMSSGDSRRLLGAVIAVAALAASVLIIAFFVGKLIWAQFGTLALILFLPPVYTVLIKAPTAQCREIMDQISGYAMFLKNRGADEDSPAEMDHAPYMLILDKDKTWLKDFAGQLDDCLRHRAKPESEQKN